MDILIKGMNMPTSCYKCPLKIRDGNDIMCPITNEGFAVEDVNILHYRMDTCPLDPVLTPYGRLIDVDALIERFKQGKELTRILGAEFHQVYSILADGLIDELNKAPIIIPADEGE